LAWGTGSTGPEGSNIGAEFTGTSNVNDALAGYVEEAGWCCPNMIEPKLITLGGNTALGKMTAAALNQIKKAANMNAIKA
jgi:hypothetical protein